MQRPFEIDVVDSSDGRGIPLVELETVNHLRFVTDSAGRVAFDEPGLMGHKTFFSVFSHGYSLPQRPMGYEGIALDPTYGGKATITLTRENIAERLCRLTGEGIYADSVALGKKTPLAQPLLDGGVMGQDTAQAELYKGRMMWFWGDTDRTSFPLGNFHTSGAVATLPVGAKDAAQGLDYHYFTGKTGFVNPMVASDDSHPIWISGLAVLETGQDQSLYGYFAQMENLGTIRRHGLLKWNDSKNQFDIVQVYDKDRAWRFLDSHTVQVDGYVLGNDPPTVRVPASADRLIDPSAFEAFTCLDSNGTVDRANGQAVYRWQKELAPINSEKELSLVNNGDLKPQEAHFLPKAQDGSLVEVVSGSVHWNTYRKRWIAILGQIHGASELGEIWYSEADAPTGPFRTAVKVVTHKNYTFYNPVHHAFLDTDGGRTIFFEGTYTSTFSGNPYSTPRYNYNQILYKLDLADPRLAFAEK